MKKILIITTVLTTMLFVSCKKEPLPQPKPTTTTTTTTTSTGSSSGTCSSAQCTGTTQTGSRCKRTTTNCSRRCYQH